MQIKNLVFEGGGVGAIAYAGFLSKAEANHILLLNNIMRVAGVSSGAIGALQVALNYSIQEILQELQETNFLQFATASPQFLVDANYFEQEFLYRYIKMLIAKKTGDGNATFADLQSQKSFSHYKDLYVVAAKLCFYQGQPDAQPFIFSHEHTPHARIVDAIRASAALPISFPPIRLAVNAIGEYTISESGHVFVDGGVVDTFPLQIFDDAAYFNQDHSPQHIYNPETLGLRLGINPTMRIPHSKNRQNEQVIRDGLQYANALLSVVSNGKHTRNDHPRDDERTVFINTNGIASTQFDLTPEQKGILFAAGEKAAIKFGHNKII